MIRSITNLNLSLKRPYVKSTIPFNGTNCGVPFCIKSLDSITSVELTHECADHGFPLNVASVIETDGQFSYYNAAGDIVSYLEGLGYTVPTGIYYFKVTMSSGKIYHTSLFTMDGSEEAPTGQGDYYSGDYSSNDYNV